MAIASVNPATGETLKSFEPLSDSALETKLQLAWDTFQIYRRTPFGERVRRMMRAAEILETESIHPEQFLIRGVFEDEQV